MLPLLRMIADFRKGAARRSTARALQRLSPAQLADIGIEPGAIDNAVEAMLAKGGPGLAFGRPELGPMPRPSMAAVPYGR